MNIPQLLYKAIGGGINAVSLLSPRAAVGFGFRLFTRTPRPRLRAKEEAFLATAHRYRLPIAGRDIAIYEWGDGPVALLAYGWGYNAGRWRHYVPGLVDAGYRVIAYDIPGHGEARPAYVTLPLNAALIRGLIEHFGTPDLFIGHSFGGASGVLAMSELPVGFRPARAVIMAAFSDARSVFADFTRRLGIWAPVRWRAERSFESLTGRPLAAFDLARASAELGETEVLIIHDPADAVTDFRHARRYQAYWPGNALWAVSGAGHHLGKAFVTEAVLDFAVSGQLPAAARLNTQVLPPQHDLVRYFAGIE